jgi:hypothetical protein
VAEARKLHTLNCGNAWKHKDLEELEWQVITYKRGQHVQEIKINSTANVALGNTCISTCDKMQMRKPNENRGRQSDSYIQGTQTIDYRLYYVNKGRGRQSDSYIQGTQTIDYNI